MQPALRIIRFATQNFLRNSWLSVVTISVLVICLIAVNVMISVGYIKGVLFSAAHERVNVTVSLVKGLSADEVKLIVDDLNKQLKIVAIETLTPEQNIDNFKNNFSDLSQRLLPVLDDNPLGYKLKIRMTNIDDYSGILSYLQQASYKDKIYSQNFWNYQLFMERAVAASNTINAIALGIAILFAALGVLVVINTIRVSIYTQREEVGIMKLVGATNWFVRGPFLIEATFYSLMSVLICFIIIYPALQLFSSSSWADLGGIKLNISDYYQRDFWLLFLGQFLGLALINGISTILALRRYLRI
ncbi:MAG: permease-like cell division protein FtsX [Candidatus Komeilibacteria bacterium]